MSDSVEKIIEEIRRCAEPRRPPRPHGYFLPDLLNNWADRLSALFGQAAQTAAPVFAYLLGEGPLDGFWFEDSDTARPKPRYWWRTYLREALKPAPPDSKELSTKGIVGTWVPVYERQPTFIQHTLVKDRNGHLSFAGFNGKYWHNGYQRVTHIVEWFDEMQIVLASPHEETVRKAFAYHAAIDSKEPAMRVKGSQG